MISVAEARARILAGIGRMPAEQIGIGEALGRVLAEPVTARLTQPPAAVSSMDGYAARAADIARVPVDLRVVGEVPAGSAHARPIGPGECVRIFTGAPLPPGADTIVIQENTAPAPGGVTVTESAAAGRWIRPAGLDFRTGEIGVSADRRMTVRDVALAAAMDWPWVRVRRRPRIALLATGDEVAMPGDPRGPNQIVSSNGLTLAAFTRAVGAVPVDLGIAADTAESLQRLAEGAAGTDLLVTTGGASVGDYDLVRSALGAAGLALDFWQIAMRPGKPLMFGRLGTTPMLGLPGNPVSSFVCALIFLGPAIRHMLGLPDAAPETATARLGIDLPANDRREDYLRSAVTRAEDGTPIVRPFARQDSSMLSLLARADAFAIRPPHAPAARVGDAIEIIPLPDTAGL